MIRAKADESARSSYTSSSADAGRLMVPMETQTHIDKETLTRGVKAALRQQGYSVRRNKFVAIDQGESAKRTIHEVSRAERIHSNIEFIQSFLPRAEQYIRDSDEIRIADIKPRIIKIDSDSIKSDLFRWWNLVWWSLPYERAYGRQMRFMVWDDAHDAPIGLIGLQSPILRWRVRDEYLGITPETRDYWVNQSMSSQRLGALPPYNKLLGGKLVTLLMTENTIRKSFQEKYQNYETILLKRVLPSNLLFITTTGAYGKSSVYNRLKFNGHNVCNFIGYTHGSGSFHIPDSLYEAFVEYLKSNGYPAGKSFGNGPSAKMKIISTAMSMLGFKSGTQHGIKRAVYLFPLVKNLESVIRRGGKPIWYNRNTKDLTEYWRERWAVKRAGDCPKEKTKFSRLEYIKGVRRDLKACENLVYTYHG